MNTEFNFPHWSRLEKAKTLEDLRIPLEIAPKDVITTAMIVAKVATYVHSHRPISQDTVKIVHRIGRIMASQNTQGVGVYYSFLERLGIQTESVPIGELVSKIEENSALESLYTKKAFAREWKMELTLIDDLVRKDAKSRLNSFLEGTQSKLQKAERLQILLTYLLNEEQECFSRLNNFLMDDEKEKKLTAMKQEGNLHTTVDIEGRDLMAFVPDANDIENDETFWAFKLLTCQIMEEIFPVYVSRRQKQVNELTEKLSSETTKDSNRVRNQCCEHLAILEKDRLGAFKKLSEIKEKIQELHKKNPQINMIKCYLSYLDYAFLLLATHYFQALCESFVHKYNGLGPPSSITPFLSLNFAVITKYGASSNAQPMRYAFAKWQENRQHQYALYQEAYHALHEPIKENRGIQFGKLRKNTVTGEALTSEMFPKTLATPEKYIHDRLSVPLPLSVPQPAPTSPLKKEKPKKNQPPAPSPSVIYHPRVERWYNHPIGHPFPREIFGDYGDKSPQEQLVDHLAHAFPLTLEPYMKNMAYKTRWEEEQEMEIIPAEMTLQGQPTIRGMLSRTKNATGEIYHSHFSPITRSELLEKIVAKSFKEVDFPDLKKSLNWSKRDVQVKREAAGEKLEIDPVFETITLNKMYTLGGQPLRVTYKLYKAQL